MINSSVRVFVDINCLLIKFFVIRCPVDNYVFPGLDRLREGDSLEARFNAFKIPESNFLVFEATVRTCREGCQPAFCSSSSGRSEPSYGRKRRSINESEIENFNVTVSTVDVINEQNNNFNDTNADVKVAGETQEEFVREMIEVMDVVNRLFQYNLGF